VPPSPTQKGDGLASRACVPSRSPRFGGPGVLDIVDIPEPEAGAGQKLYDVSAAGANFADTQDSLS
jgi:hypothetical protein